MLRIYAAFLFMQVGTAFILSGEMAVAHFQAHAPRGFWTLTNGGTDAVLYCFIWLFFSATGAGALSLDAQPRRSTPGVTRANLGACRERSRS